MIDTCRRARDADALAAVLRRLGSAASPEAHLRLVQTCCECGGKDGAADMPRAVLALNAMEEANMLSIASPAVVLQLYAALVRGYGALGDLDSAHAAFLEGRRWLTQLSSASSVAPLPGRARVRP